MKVKALVSFTRRLVVHPCKQLLIRFKFIKLKRPLSIKGLGYHRQPRNAAVVESKRAILKQKISGLLPHFHKKQLGGEDMDRLRELRSFSDAGREGLLLYPSPLTPAYVKSLRPWKSPLLQEEDEVEDACKSFENYLVQMIVEEKKVRDLMDVEELLYCWGNLKSPVFVELVSRFYGELCKDLFSPAATHSDDDDDDAQRS